jgi:hypothetical protein
MPLSKGHRNKQKQWRLNSPSKHQGRKMKNYFSSKSFGIQSLPSNLFNAMCAKIGIKLVTVESQPILMSPAKRLQVQSVE